jgi:hypothetical protein
MSFLVLPCHFERDDSNSPKTFSVQADEWLYWLGFLTESAEQVAPHLSIADLDGQTFHGYFSSWNLLRVVQC